MPRSRVTVSKKGFNVARLRVREATAEAIRSATLDVLRDAVSLAPLLKGELRGSASAHHDGERIATGADVDSSASSGTPMEGAAGSSELRGVVYFNSIYAAAQHEKTDQAHTVGQAKYLETAVNLNRKKYEQQLAESIRDELGE